MYVFFVYKRIKAVDKHLKLSKTRAGVMIFKQHVLLKHNLQKSPAEFILVLFLIIATQLLS